MMTIPGYRSYLFSYHCSLLLWQTGDRLRHNFAELPSLPCNKYSDWFFAHLGLCMGVYLSNGRGGTRVGEGCGGWKHMGLLRVMGSGGGGGGGCQLLYLGCSLRTWHSAWLTHVRHMHTQYTWLVTRRLTLTHDNWLYIFFFRVSSSHFWRLSLTLSSAARAWLFWSLGHNWLIHPAMTDMTWLRRGVSRVTALGSSGSFCMPHLATVHTAWGWLSAEINSPILPLRRCQVPRAIGLPACKTMYRKESFFTDPHWPSLTHQWPARNNHWVKAHPAEAAVHLPQAGKAAFKYAPSLFFSYRPALPPHLLLCDCNRNIQERCPPPPPPPRCRSSTGQPELRFGRARTAAPPPPPPTHTPRNPLSSKINRTMSLAAEPSLKPCSRWTFNERREGGPFTVCSLIHRTFVCIRLHRRLELDFFFKLKNQLLGQV